MGSLSGKNQLYLQMSVRIVKPDLKSRETTQLPGKFVLFPALVIACVVRCMSGYVSTHQMQAVIIQFLSYRGWSDNHPGGEDLMGTSLLLPVESGLMSEVHCLSELVSESTAEKRHHKIILMLWRESWAKSFNQLRLDYSERWGCCWGWVEFECGWWKR